MVWARARTRRSRRLPRRPCRTPSRRRADPPERNSPARRPAVVPAFGGSLVPSPARECQSSHPSEPNSPPPRGANDGRIPSHPTPAPHRFVRRAPHRAVHPRRSRRRRTRAPATRLPHPCPGASLWKAALPRWVVASLPSTRGPPPRTEPLPVDYGRAIPLIQTRLSSDRRVSPFYYP